MKNLTKTDTASGPEDTTEGVVERASVLSALRRIIKYLKVEEVAEHLGIPVHISERQLDRDIQAVNTWLMKSGEKVIHKEGESRDTLSDGSDHFGGCPTCKKNDGHLNVGSDHWFLCDTHKVKWCAGSNLFGVWREQSEEEWRANHATLLNYTEVEPVYPSSQD